MSTAIWGESEPKPDEVYPVSLLKHLLQQMIGQFSAVGGCIALLNEQSEQMVIRQHIRLRTGVAPSSNTATTSKLSHPQAAPESGPLLPRVLTPPSLSADPSASAISRVKRTPPTLDDMVELVTPQQSDLFPVGASYTPGQDLIGYVWHKNETHIMRHDDYMAFFYSTPQVPLRVDVQPSWYLVVPIQESTLVDEVRGKRRQPKIIGIIILYQTLHNGVFYQKQRAEARDFAERIALFLQNDQLLYRKRRAEEYLKELQEISTAFPSSLQLSQLVEKVYEFATHIADVSSMLITFYDRDTGFIYDVFAVQNKTRVAGVTENPPVMSPSKRPLWWKVTQHEKQTLLLEPAHLELDSYDELLTGSWGDQRRAESFLLLPMKMFNRVVGSVCLASMRQKAYQPEEILVLETMVQIITVSTENAKLYENTRKALRETKQREESLAAMNSALQTISISTALNVNEIMNKFVESATKLVSAEMSVFFQCTPDNQYLAVQTAYEPPKKQREPQQAPDAEQHHLLFDDIRIPFKGTQLEYLVGTGFFYLDKPMAEDLARESNEGAAIFLLETGIEKMLMVPVLYQAELVGILGVHMPKQSRIFRPTEVGMLLALSSQAASAIRNAQLFEQIQEAYAEQKRLDKLKDEFLVTASHELRTPLSAISGYASLLKRQNNRINPQQITRFSTKIMGAAQQMTDLVSSMTDAAKIGTLDSKLNLQIGPVQMQSAVELAKSIISVNIEQKIVSQVSPDLWVSADPLHVRQVLSNLLDNAAKYSPPDSRIEIIAGATILSKVDLPDDQYEVERDQNMPVVVVQVYDEGEGVAPDDQKRIFEKFVRATRSLTTTVRGSGVGLFICRRYIEAMGGKLWLQHSIPGEGSTFSFYLPRLDAPIDSSKEDEELESAPE